MRTKALPIVEWISWLLAITGLIFKYFTFAGANMLLVLGLATLAFVYFLAAFLPTTKEAAPYPGYVPVATAEKSFLADMVVPRIQGQAMAAALIGILFKLLFWPGANVLLIIGTLSLAVVEIIQLFYNSLSRKAVVVAVLGALMLYTSSDALVQLFYRHDPELAARLRYHLHHPNDQAATAELRQLQQTRRK